MKKICSFLLVVIIMFNISVSLKVIAAEDIERTYTYEGYTITYNIISSWKSNQNVSITITNTSNESIVGWALKYNANGEIYDLWNGIVYSSNDTKYVIKNAGYNYEIKPFESITFGYTLTGENLAMPQKFEICSHRVKKEDGFIVNLKEINYWETGFNGEIAITNLTNKPVEAWTLIFESSFTIEDLWSATIVAQSNNKYEIANQQWTTPIQPNTRTTFGFRASYNKNVKATIENITLTEVIIDENFESVEFDITDKSYSDDIYYKSVTSKNEVVYDDIGFAYVRNQILLMADDNISFQEMSNIANDLNAEIVGYIDILNKYQIEFKFDTNLDYLNSIIDEFRQKPYVESISLNYFFDTEVTSSEDDSFPKENIESNIYNWNLHTINVFQAWNYYSQMSTVNIGLIEQKNSTGKNKYLKYKKTWTDPLIITTNFPQETKEHSMHVAGIMASDFNDEKGTGGVCPKNKLYGCFIGNGNGLMDQESAICKLVKNNVKVINISLSTLNGIELLFLKNDSKETKQELKKESEEAYNTLKKLVNKGYDFVLVVGAGNDNVEAEYGNYLNGIDNDIKGRIIVVGAIGEINNANYYYWGDCNWGSRVDVTAPGVKVFSTVSDDSYESYTGSSQAAPHVAGIAGMIYAVDPSIPAPFVKAIIVKTSKLRTVSDNYGNEYGIADAGLAVSTAYYYNKSDKIIFGKLIDSNDSSKIYDNVELIVTYNQNGLSTTQNIQTDENGEYELVIPKEINISDLNIKIDEYSITETKCLEEFLNSSAVVETKVIPVKSSIIGKVTEYNKTKKTTKPLGDVYVSVYKDDSIIASANTKSDGTYKIELNRQGDFIVKFSEEKQKPIYISNGEYIVDAVFEVEDEEDDKNENDKDNKDENKDNKENEYWDIDENEKINIILNGDGSSNFTGDYSGDLFNGIWLHTYAGINDYYVHVYITPTAGEYTSRFGSAGGGLYTTRYHYWKHELKMATYTNDGTLIKEQTLKKYYEDIYIYVPKWYLGSTPSTPLMQTDSINSIVISNTGITYNVHTDGYYKGRENAIGSLGIRKENWTMDEKNSINFYNNSKVNGIITKQPF